MDIETFLNDLDSAWDEWQDLITSFSPNQLTLRVDEHWSVKDHIAHITWYEREMIAVARDHKLEGSDWWDLAFEERTQAIFNLNKDADLNTVLAESAKVHMELRAALGKLDDEDLTDASHYQYMPEDWLPLQIFAGSTNNHYREHTTLVKAWFHKE